MLRRVFLQLFCSHRLLKFIEEGARPWIAKPFQLHRQRACATANSEMAHILPERADGAFPIDSDVFKKTAVFNCDDGVEQVWADLVLGEWQPPLSIEGDERGQRDTAAVFDEGAVRRGQADSNRVRPPGDGGAECQK